MDFIVLKGYCFFVSIGGAGGKGVWGTPGEVYDEDEVDVKDPNYDAEQVKATRYALFWFLTMKWALKLVSPGELCI